MLPQPATWNSYADTTIDTTSSIRKHLTLAGTTTCAALPSTSTSTCISLAASGSTSCVSLASSAPTGVALPSTSTSAGITLTARSSSIIALIGFRNNVLHRR